MPDEKPVEKKRDSAKRQGSAGSIKTVKSRKSIVDAVFIRPQSSVPERLGRHLYLQDTSVEGEKRRKVIVKRTKCQECQLFCCNKENKTCMGKNGKTWILEFVFLFIYWAFLILLMFVFFEVYKAIEGSAPDMHSSSTEEKTPRLTDSDTVKNNAKGGWAGGTINFPFKFGAQLFFPGIKIVTRDVWWNSTDSDKKKKFDEYADDPVFNFPTGKDGKPTAEWVKTQKSVYADFFNQQYHVPENDIELCEGNLDEFRHADMKNGICEWPISSTTNGSSMVTHYCNDEKPPKCFPYLYFTVNRLFGWIPQKSKDKNYGNIFCELHPTDVKNENFKSADFAGSGELNCTNADDDFCGIHLARFPYYGQPGLRSPVIRYKITKLPDTAEEFVIHCRLDYDGYDKQIKSMGYPFSFRESRSWSKIRMSGADSCEANKQLMTIFLMMTVIILKT